MTRYSRDYMRSHVIKTQGERILRCDQRRIHVLPSHSRYHWVGLQPIL